MAEYPVSSPYIPRVETPQVYAFEHLQKEVSKFQDELPDDCEVGISVNGADNVIHVHEIRRTGQMFVFSGFDNFGRTARLIQHFTQVNVQMVAVDKLNETASRIGF